MNFTHRHVIGQGESLVADSALPNIVLRSLEFSRREGNEAEHEQLEARVRAEILPQFRGFVEVFPAGVAIVRKREGAIAKCEGRIPIIASLSSELNGFARGVIGLDRPIDTMQCEAEKREYVTEGEFAARDRAIEEFGTCFLPASMMRSGLFEKNPPSESTRCTPASHSGSGSLRSATSARSHQRWASTLRKSRLRLSPNDAARRVPR